jgi:hypothetical protein
VRKARVSYRSREEASAEGERGALCEAYAFVQRAVKNAEPGRRPDVRDGTHTQGDDSADGGSIREHR